MSEYQVRAGCGEPLAALAMAYRPRLRSSSLMGGCRPPYPPPQPPRLRQPYGPPCTGRHDRSSAHLRRGRQAVAAQERGLGWGPAGARLGAIRAPSARQVAPIKRQRAPTPGPVGLCPNPKGNARLAAGPLGRLFQPLFCPHCVLKLAAHRASSRPQWGGAPAALRPRGSPPVPKLPPVCGLRPPWSAAPAQPTGHCFDYHKRCKQRL